MKQTASFAVISFSLVLAFFAPLTQSPGSLLKAAPAVHSGEATPTEHLGEVNFPTSCNARAQASIETGVALLHSFQYEEAGQTFARATQADPQCALAHWGTAMSRFEQLWDFPGKHAMKLGLSDIQQAQKLAGTSGKDAPVTSDRERAYIAAAAAFYGADPKFTHTQYLQAYSAALAKLHEQFPDDVNAAAFYALSLTVLAEDGGDDATANRKKAIAILQPLCQKAPNNPGPAHYLIHATDTPEFASLGLDAARAYAKIAPDSSHALHMPSHIFVRLGLWDESIQSNIAAASAAAKATQEHRGAAHYQFHALDFLNYSYLQSGDESRARQVIEQLKGVPGASAEDIADHAGYMTARVALELHRWKDAASLAIPDVKKDWKESSYRVRAIGAARCGDPQSARKDLEKYVDSTRSGDKHAAHSAHRSYKPSTEKSWEQLETEAWIAYAEGKSDEAVKTLRSAAEKQETDGLDSLAMPAREMLADMLFELKRPADALAEYQAALKASPNRFDALYGAARAAEAAGDLPAARGYYNSLLAVTSASADRPELAQVKSELQAAKR
jgi:tetratricopeptide (TPR) repeat protein